LLFVEEVTKKREHLFRLRFSFGIQSFENTILQSSKRAYTYEQLPDFLRKLQKIKGANVVYNLDFIAFGDTVLEDKMDKKGKKDKEGTEEFLPR
jgi:histone acetyltransferase (RNA polymerase elongator complex component)